MAIPSSPDTKNLIDRIIKGGAPLTRILADEKALDHIIEKTMPITRERESSQFTFLIDASVKE